MTIIMFTPCFVFLCMQLFFFNNSRLPFQKGNKDNTHTIMHKDCTFDKNYLFNNMNQEEEYT